MSNDDHMQTNRELWDGWTGIHETSELYDMESFRRGRCSLAAIEVEEVGEVTGKRLLHLQCHFGQDTLSWARRGATVTGADFSPKAIALARSLATELDISAEFVCSNVYDLPDSLEGEFDIVFTSAGVLCWLPDLTRWAEVIAHFLASGGIFYIREFHKFANTYDWAEDAAEPIVRNRYFPTDRPERFEGSGSYGGAEPGVKRVSYEWQHSLSEIINSVMAAGLRLEFLHEFPYCTYQHLPFLTQGDDGLWRYDKVDGGIPLMFSLKARRA